MESVEISDHIQGLIQQINDKTTAIPSLNTANAEAARVAAIKATQDLLRVLQTPEESVVNITYSVCLNNKVINQQLYLRTYSHISFF